MIAWSRYIILILGWAVLGSIILSADFAHPLAVGVVWIIGFVWLTGWAASDGEDADALLKYWLITLAIMAIGGGLLYLAIFPFT